MREVDKTSFYYAEGSDRREEGRKRSRMESVKVQEERLVSDLGEQETPSKRTCCSRRVTLSGEKKQLGKKARRESSRVDLPMTRSWSSKGKGSGSEAPAQEMLRKGDYTEGERGQADPDECKSYFFREKVHWGGNGSRELLG